MYKIKTEGKLVIVIGFMVYALDLIRDIAPTNRWHLFSSITIFICAFLMDFEFRLTKQHGSDNTTESDNK